MASLRTSLILALVAGSLLVFILWFERGTPSSGELERRKDSALPDFVREHVTKLEIQRRGQLTVLVRSDSEDESEPVWRVEKPFRGPADRDLVDNLLGELEFAETRRSLSDISSADRERFGFERSRTLLMPEASSRQELEARSAEVSAWSLALQVRFSSRLHLALWGGRRGT